MGIREAIITIIAIQDLLNGASLESIQGKIQAAIEYSVIACVERKTLKDGLNYQSPLLKSILPSQFNDQQGTVTISEQQAEKILKAKETAKDLIKNLMNKKVSFQEIAKKMRNFNDDFSNQFHRFHLIKQACEEFDYNYDDINAIINNEADYFYAQMPKKTFLKKFIPNIIEQIKLDGLNQQGSLGKDEWVCLKRLKKYIIDQNNSFGRNFGAAYRQRITKRKLILAVFAYLKLQAGETYQKVGTYVRHNSQLLRYNWGGTFVKEAGTEIKGIGDLESVVFNCYNPLPILSSVRGPAVYKSPLNEQYSKFVAVVAKNPKTTELNKNEKQIIREARFHKSNQYDMLNPLMLANYTGSGCKITVEQALKNFEVFNKQIQNEDSKIQNDLNQSHVNKDKQTEIELN